MFTTLRNTYRRRFYCYPVFITVSSSTSIHFSTHQAMSHKFDYDIIVIGGGSGGLACSKEAADLGRKVAVLDFVEPSPRGTTWGLGGTCVNVGCIPKKLFHHAAQHGHTIQDAKHFGWLNAGSDGHNWETLRSAVQNYIKSLNFGHRTKLREKKVDYIKAKGVFVDDHTIKAIFNNKEQTLTAATFVLAMGLRPSFPEIPGARELCITSDDLFSLKSPPGKTLVIGGGYVALECAGFLTAFGYDTTVMVRSVPLRSFDQQMTRLIADHMKGEGTKFLQPCVPLRVEKENDRLRVVWKKVHTLKEEVTDTFDTVLIATGRSTSCFKGLHMDHLGIKLDKDNFIIVDTKDTTTVPNIFAIGDIAHPTVQLTPAAIQAGKMLARRLSGFSSELMDYRNIATTVFTPLEYGTVGMSEETATKEFGANNIEVYHAFYKPLEYTVPGRESAQCYIKAVCNSRDSQRVVGLHFLGPNAGEVMQGFAAAMKCGLTMKILQNTVGIHPTCAEELVKLHITKRSGINPEVSGC